LVFKMNDNLILTAYMKKIYIKNGKSATNRSFSYVFVCCWAYSYEWKNAFITQILLYLKKVDLKIFKNRPEVVSLLW